VEFEAPDEVDRLEEEIRLINEEMARRDIQRNARRPDVTPPRLPDGVIPAHIRAMGDEALDDHLDRVTRDLEHAQSGWRHYDDD